MILHICTISHRNEFLQDIYDSIPWYPDVVWHIARAHNNPVPDWLLSKEQIRVHDLTCEDIDTSFKMNYIFNNIVTTDPDSYFCLLDDDTNFCILMYELFKECRGRQFMIIGKQMDKDWKVRLQPTLPYECAIDSGNVLCHSSVLQDVKWPTEHWDDEFHADFDFWNRCFQYFGIKRTDLVDRPISIYNFYSDKPDSLDYVR